MKKTCSGCRALDGGRCNLGYKNKGVSNKEFIGMVISYKPLEDCPKPYTYKNYIKLYFEKDN